MNKLYSTVKFLIGWPLSLIALFFVFKVISSNYTKLTIDVSEIKIELLTLAVFLFFVYYLMRDFLWQLTLKEKGYKIPFKDSTYAFTTSELKRFVPGNIWSFLSRAAQFRDLGVDRKTLLITTLADIQFVIIGCGVVSLFSLPMILSSKINISPLLPLTLLGVAIFFLATSFIYSKKYAHFNKKSLILPSIELFSNFILPGFRLNSKIKLSAISVLTYSIFGLGNYLIFLSIFPYTFDILFSLILSSFFVFSLLLGYLSFITPMGLGVREGVITLGLTKILSLADAGYFSVFSRIVLILSEALFLLLIVLWKKFHK